LVYLYSTIKMMHDPINVSFISYLSCVGSHDCLFFGQNPKVGKIQIVWNY